MTMTLSLIPPTVDIPRTTELAYAIAETIIASLERDDRLIGEWRSHDADSLAEEIQKILSHADEYISPVDTSVVDAYRELMAEDAAGR